MGNIILALLWGYLGVLGLVHTVAMIVRWLWPPKPPAGCALILTVGEEPDYTESRLEGCRRLLSQQETAGLPWAVAIPQNEEAGGIVQRYCRDRSIATICLPPAAESIIIEQDE